MPVPKKYTPEDLKTLIKVASQIHSQREDKTDQEFSKTEIIEIAKAAGLPLDVINQALGYLSTHEESRWIPDKEETIHVSKFIENQHSGINMDAVTNNSRKKFKIQGTATQFGSTFEWSASPSKTKHVHISIKQSGQLTKADLFLDYSKLGNRIKTAGSVIGFLLLAIFSSVMNLDSISNWVPAIINFSGAGLGYFFSSRLFEKYLKRKKSKAALVLDTILTNTKTEENIITLNEDNISNDYSPKDKLRH